MSLILDGTNGVSDIDGTAATPAIRGTDTNTGIFFPAADTIAFSEGGAEVARFNSSGNLGIGNTNPTFAKLVVNGSGTSNGIITNTAAALNGGGNALNIGDDGTNVLMGPGNSASSLSLLSRAGGVYSRALTIDSDGRVFTPLQPCFHVRVNSGLYITTSPIPFSNAPINVGSTFNTSTYKFTAPVAGKYYFLLMLYVRIIGSGDATAYVRVNSSNRQYLNYITGSSSYNTITMPSIFNLGVGDTVDYTFVTGAGGTYYGGNEETNLFGWLIG
jgi:hypothetical protein